MYSNFSHILTESRRLNRDLPTLMPDEFRLSPEMECSISAGTYQFPDAREIQTGRRVLTRTQDYFSEKIHLYRTPFYFHRHTFVELLRECRLEKAAALLAGTEYPIEKIAELLASSRRC